MVKDKHFGPDCPPSIGAYHVDDLSRRSMEQAASRVLISPDPVQINFRLPSQNISKRQREEDRIEQRRFRLVQRAVHDDWTTSELYTAINNGCRIGRVYVLRPCGPFRCTVSSASFPAAHRAGASTGTRKVLPSLGVSSLDCRGANAPAFLGKSA